MIDVTDVLPIVQQSINLKAVSLSIIATQLIRYALPSGEEKITSTVAGWSNRLLPVLPLAFGMLFCGLIERDSSYVLEDLIRGVFSGAMAAYSYRLVKVSFFGG